ncbi:uncharacterized protein [Drosophila pseudoobscura]|uniref:Uncharacterized protein n=1 Tax=Drosophila pseudoobscura pseudoobscura TaxID=46245 RepID=A0A6I8V2G5_DROPS|nr:uncharacterized protein LOC6897220 [Drosophila pseudoobscura]
MFGKIKVVLILLLAQAVSEETEQPQMTFLTKLIQRIHKEVPIRTLLMLQHHQDKDCSIQDWNPDGIPILRANELIEIDMRKHFNQKSVALVCLEEPSHLSLLLDALVKSFDHLRYVRILLWTQGNPTEEFLKQISDKAEEHKFLHMIVLGLHQRGETMHRLKPFPSPRFERIENVSCIKGSVFDRPTLNFQGRTATVLQNLNIPFTIKNAPAVDFPIKRIEDMQIVEFAMKYNLTLTRAQKKDSDVTDPYVDIELSPHFVSKSDLLQRVESVNAFTLSSLMVVVPCGKERSIAKVYRLLDLRTWFLYILSVYATFVVAESVILVATHRILGRSYRLTNLNPCVNMRAFRAILGLPFPIGPRLTVSLRLLFLAMSLFGMIFSNFFSCKLSSLLTKLPLQPQVESFEQLRTSGLTVIGLSTIQSFIEHEIDEEFTRRYLSNVKFLDTLKYADALIAGNTSFAFIVVRDTWKGFERFQQIIGRKIFCESQNLSIIENLPKMYKMQKGSIYKWHLTKFFMTFFESGIPSYWKNTFHYNIRERLNVTIPRNLKPEFVPLSLHHLKWLGWVLACGYGLATVVFLVEVYMGNRKRKVESKVPAPLGNQEIDAV